MMKISNIVRIILMPTTIGDRIRKQRLKIGYSICKLSKLSQVSRAYIWYLEHNRSMNPTMGKIKQLADALEVTSNHLCGINDKAFDVKKWSE